MNKISSTILISAALIVQAACQSPSDQDRNMRNNSTDPKSAEKAVSFNDGRLVKHMEIKSGQTDTIFIFVHRADSVRIKIKTPSDTANIRISQLFSPNGTADGPFGKELTYRFIDSGKYFITINENKMVGNHYTGSYEVEIIPN
ncbi:MULTISPECIES: hypothetical protein [unclassified Sphingobacterium]|uniref:hypothetical protein n=1 Tax=unclassified Sphingobacterium TaxID=2609468 RepID=UPI0025E9B24F|nr:MULTISPECIES: hypothetical protein [unclassified Sphingobacterium]